MMGDCVNQGNNSQVIPTPVNDLAELENMYRQHLVKK
jgi:hypothetical protein